MRSRSSANKGGRLASLLAQLQKWHLQKASELTLRRVDHLELADHPGVVWSMKSLLGQKRDRQGLRCSQVPDRSGVLIDIDRIAISLSVGAMLVESMLSWRGRRLLKGCNDLSWGSEPSLMPKRPSRLPSGVPMA